MTNKLKALLLDFGGVIGLTSFEMHAFTEKLLGLKPGTLNWRGPFDPESDPLWQSMQRDEITEREYWAIRARQVGRLVGETWDTNKFMRTVKCTSPDEGIRSEAVETVRLAKDAGLKVGALSNELELFYGKDCVERISIVRELDVVVDASHTRILKPDPQAYHLALEALNTAPRETLFVDDQMRNVVGAQQVGLRALHFDVTRPAACYAQIQDFLSLPAP